MKLTQFIAQYFLLSREGFEGRIAQEGESSKYTHGWIEIRRGEYHFLTPVTAVAVNKGYVVDTRFGEQSLAQTGSAARFINFDSRMATLIDAIARGLDISYAPFLTFSGMILFPQRVELHEVFGLPNTQMVFEFLKTPWLPAPVSV